MHPRVLAALLGIAGGLLLVVAGGLSFLSQEGGGWRGGVAVVGYAGTLAALCLMGYGLAASAPVWLRIIVSIAFPLLIASVWQVVDQAVDDHVHGWKAAAEVHLLGGVLVLVVALVGLRRSAPDHEDAYAPTHHR